jgi:hypothetical protein
MPPLLADMDDQAFERMLERGAVSSRPLRMSDNACPGLRIIIRHGNQATFHCQYTVAGRKKVRPSIMLGTWPEMSLEKARAVTRTIMALAKIGIDVSAGLEKRLVRELEEQGTNWRA